MSRKADRFFGLLGVVAFVLVLFSFVYTDSSVFSGSYDDLDDLPDLFSGDYDDLIGLPVPDLYDDLVCWLPFDGSGRDVVGDFDLGMSGVTYESGVYGSCAYFDGSGFGMNEGYTVTYDEVHTINFWVRCADNFYSTNYAQAMALAGWNGYGYNQMIYLKDYSDDDSRFGIIVEGDINNHYWCSQGALLPFDEWHMLTFIANGTHCAFYLDTELEYLSSALDCDLSINRFGNLNVGVTLEGEFMIDDFRIYDRDLDDDEMYVLLTQGGLYPSEGVGVSDLSHGLFGHWNFDYATAGGSALDCSGNGLDGTISGAVISTSGYYANCLSFDGVDDYVRVNMPYDVLGGGAVAVRPDQSKLCVYVGGGWRIDDVVDDLDAGVWNSLIVVSDGASYTIAYLNGVEVGNVAYYFSNPVTFSCWFYHAGGATSDRERLLNWNSATDYRIGYMNNAGNAFYGLIDDVRLYNRALSNYEIGCLFALGV